MGVLKREPWEHVCECGKTFLSAAHNALYCPECRKVRSKEQHHRYRQSDKGRESNIKRCKRWRERKPGYSAEYSRKWRAEHPEERLAYQREYRKDHAEHINLTQRLRHNAKRGNITAKLELAKLTGKALYCERMRVTAMSLPCGKRDECWNGKPCPRTIELGLKPPRRRELFDFGKLV